MRLSETVTTNSVIWQRLRAFWCIHFITIRNVFKIDWSIILSANSVHQYHILLLSLMFQLLKSKLSELIVFIHLLFKSIFFQIIIMLFFNHAFIQTFLHIHLGDMHFLIEFIFELIHIILPVKLRFSYNNSFILILCILLVYLLVPVIHIFLILHSILESF